jgi:D-xylose transport system substrate-binding protein
MRNSTIKAVVLVSLFIGIALFQSFRPEDAIKVGLSYSNTKQDRWLKDRSIFEKTISQSGGQVLFEAANSDTSNQLEQVKRLIKKGIKVLVVVPGNAEMSVPIVELAHKAGIKVIAYDRLLTNSDLDYYISYDNEKVGELQAKHVVQQKPAGNFILINGPVTDNNSKFIKKGIMKVLSPLVTKGTVKIVFDQSLSSWSNKEAYTTMDNFLTKNNDKKIDAVLAANDDIAMGVIKALKKHNKSGNVIITGQDADLENCREIIAGNMSMTVYKPIKPLAYIAALTAMSLAKQEPVNDATDTIFNGKVKVPSIILTPFSIDKNTIQNVIIDGHLKEEDVFKK